MNNHCVFLIKIFVLALISLTVHAQEITGNKIIGEDSESDLSSIQLLNNINPITKLSSRTSDTGYDHLKGKIILYVPDLYNGLSQANGVIRFAVTASGKIQASYNLIFASVVDHNYNYDYRYMYGRPFSNLINGTLYHSAVGYGPGYGEPYDGMVALDNVGVSAVNTENISFPPYMSATATPAGVSIEFNGELTGIYQTVFYHGRRIG